MENRFEDWMKNYKKLVEFREKFPDKWQHARLKNRDYSELGKWVGYNHLASMIASIKRQAEHHGVVFA